jgi:hypothetical protein
MTDRHTTRFVETAWAVRAAMAYGHAGATKAMQTWFNEVAAQAAGPDHRSPDERRAAERARDRENASPPPPPETAIVKIVYHLPRGVVLVTTDNALLYDPGSMLGTLVGRMASQLYPGGVPPTDAARGVSVVRETAIHAAQRCQLYDLTAPARPGAPLELQTSAEVHVLLQQTMLRTGTYIDTTAPGEQRSIAIPVCRPGTALQSELMSTFGKVLRRPTASLETLMACVLRLHTRPDGDTLVRWFHAACEMHCAVQAATVAELRQRVDGRSTVTRDLTDRLDADVRALDATLDALHQTYGAVLASL